MRDSIKFRIFLPSKGEVTEWRAYSIVVCQVGGGPRGNAGSENVIQIYGKLAPGAIYGCPYHGKNL